MAEIRVRALGTLYIAAGKNVPTRAAWGSRWAKDLFLLALQHPEGMLKDQILEALWPNKPVYHALASFHNAAYRLRRVLPGCFVYEDGLYRVAREMEIDYDVEQFTRLLRRAGASQNDRERMENYQAAVELYRGDFYSECYGDWCEEIRQHLRRKYLDALLVLAQACEPHDGKQAIAYYRRLVETERDREDVYYALMQLQYRMGDRTGALKTFRQCARVLREELNVPGPSRETLALYERIVNESG